MPCMIVLDMYFFSTFLATLLSLTIVPLFLPFATELILNAKHVRHILHAYMTLSLFTLDIADP